LLFIDKINAKTRIKDHDHQNYNKFHKLYFYDDEVVKIEHPKFTFLSMELKIHLWDKNLCIANVSYLNGIIFVAIFATKMDVGGKEF
jgi:hypothetical protein